MQFWRRMDSYCHFYETTFEKSGAKEKINSRYEGKRSTERGGRNKTRKNKKRRRSTIKNKRYKYFK